eukprot:snap_masked-scaffold_23-processed-gene-0.16-mRNA-1 protein AED:1.00 eAED:1.00 QI:0/0/0/0/1/1/2/0/82
MKFLASEKDVMEMMWMDSGSKTEMVKVSVMSLKELRRSLKMMKLIKGRMGRGIVSKEENKAGKFLVRRWLYYCSKYETGAKR